MKIEILSKRASLISLNTIIIAIMEAKKQDIVDLFITLAKDSAARTEIVLIVTGAFFVYNGLTFTTATVTGFALGFMGVGGVIATGLVFIGAGIWLAIIKARQAQIAQPQPQQLAFSPGP